MFWLIVLIWFFCLTAAIAALYQAHRFYGWMVASDPGTERMQQIAGYVRAGADAYLSQQYRIIAAVFAVIFLLLLWVSFGMGVLSKFVPFAFLISGFLSGLAGWFGMKTATQASNRTAAAAQRSMNDGLQVAFRSGAVMGLVVVGLALLDVTIWTAVLYFALGYDLTQLSVIMLCFGMGASGQALFARVGGGIFTKAADVGADLVGKIEKGIPEDDARNPAVIADNVGDNVGDVAGMGADLYESFYGAILAAATLGVSAFASPRMYEQMGLGVVKPETIAYYQLGGLLLPIAIAALGVAFSVLGIYLVRTKEETSQKLLSALGFGIIVATAGTVAASLIITPVLLGTAFFGISGSIVVGLVAGWLIGKWTEYRTSGDYRPTQYIADQAVFGPATVIISGVAEGMLSTWAPVLIITSGTLLSYGLASNWNFAASEFHGLGLYGVGIAAVGMLSTLGITLATDAYGPIADNAGGNAQMSDLDPLVRERTDALDSLGNTTAATGKGFAIGSAALTAMALIAAYVEEVRVSFSQWGAAAVGADAKPGVYKVSPHFIVEVPANNQPRRHWMIFPSETDLKAWNALDARSAPVEVGAQGMQLNTPHATATRATVHTGAADAVIEVGSLEAFSLRDFMRFYDASLMNPKVLAGVFIGAMLTNVFCALTIMAVGRAASKMVEEVRRQFREKPGLFDGTDVPDYTQPVTISTKAAQREMMLPALLGIVSPVLCGFLLGVPGVIGLLVGALTSGFCTAIFMANSGGAWDNAKKLIEAGRQGGKGTDAHKAAVVGDTVGDPFKDTSGPSLNILIKLMSMVAVVTAGLTIRYSFHALGIF